MTRLVASTLVAAALQTTYAATQTTPAQRIARKIVVLAVEDAVNIIQQKTAVAPLVEELFIQSADSLSGNYTADGGQQVHTTWTRQ